MKRILIIVIAIIGISISCCKKDNKPVDDGSGVCAPSQCIATDLSTGDRCQLTTTNCSGLCEVHN